MNLFQMILVTVVCSATEHLEDSRRPFIIYSARSTLLLFFFAMEIVHSVTSFSAQERENLRKEKKNISHSQLMFVL